MPVFEYKAIDQKRVSRHGVINSDSPRQARQELRELGLSVTQISETQAGRKRSNSLGSLFRRNWDHWVAGFTGELATLLSVGVPLLDALTTLIAQYKGHASTIVIHLKDNVSSGRPLAESMSRQPEVFDTLCIKMVEVGENTGNLDDTLRQLSDFKRRSLEFKDRVLSALLYPMVILTVSLGVSIFLMTIVVPMLLENLEDTGKPLPLPTRLLKGASDVLVIHGWWLGILLGGAFIWVLMALQTDAGRRIRDRLLLRIPLIGTMSRKQELARIALVIATLMKSGVEFVKAIDIAVGTTKNLLLREALMDCSRQVESGKDIGIALENWSYFPPLVTQVFTVGQESGRMEEMLFRLSQDYDRQVESMSGRLSTVIEPVLILILSAFVGFIMFATLLPILEAGNVF